MIRERVGKGPVLEIGCGRGDDTATLIGHGHRVVAFDVSAAAVDEARARVPGAEFHRQDVRDALPVSSGGVGVVVASLSLHYFSWPETVDIVGRIRAALESPGLFLCRLNSTNDYNYGASGYPRIEPDYYLVEGRRKRFFDEASVARLFVRAWRVISMQESTTGKYGRPKVVWEIVAERYASGGHAS